MKAFTELGTPRDMSKIFESAELVTWKAFGIQKIQGMYH